MTTKFSYADFAKGFVGVILASLAFANLQAGTTALGTEPFTSSTKINALPNVMFVLDDSGSMENDYLPDWAGPYKDLSNAIAIPTHQFFNSSFNGVAYNPATRYRPPVMYSNTGPSQNGQSVAQGGDATATTLSPNWRAVKKDGYGIQFNTTANLEGNAFSYTTTAGEYCTNAQLRTCTASSVPTGVYTFPAKLRWCTTSVRAAGTTADSNGYDNRHHG
jgi:type IV pilus assembly protein PilY1